MLKPTQPMMARLRLTTKQVNGGYYKGNRTGSMGHFDKRGTYIPDAKKHRVYMAPEKLEVPGKYYSEEKSKEPFMVSVETHSTTIIRNVGSANIALARSLRHKTHAQDAIELCPRY